VPPSLDPERVPPPPTSRLSLDALRWPIIGGVASIAVVPVIYLLFFSGNSLPLTPQPPKAPTLASVAPAAALPAMTTPVERPSALASLPPNKAQQSIVSKRVVPSEPEQHPTASEPEQRATISEPERHADPADADARPAPVEAEKPATASPEPSKQPVRQATAETPPVRKLDPSVIALLIKQGEEFIAQGDVATARLVFQRAAEAGDATAAMALGATYDPTVIARLGARGFGPDVEKARMWYEKAKELGSPEAPRRLELLAHR
jgi:hypothetical protein